MAMAFLRSVLGSMKEKGFRKALGDAKEQGFLASLVDGNLMETKLHGQGARLVGTDQFGNKYYEKLANTMFGRHRWVEYADKKMYNASSVPPEWHGWLHYVTDHTPEQLKLLKPVRYGVEHRPNRTGEGEEFIHHAKGHAMNPKKRDWARYDTWQPS